MNAFELSNFRKSATTYKCVFYYHQFAVLIVKSKSFVTAQLIAYDVSLQQILNSLLISITQRLHNSPTKCSGLIDTTFSNLNEGIITA